MKKKKNTEEDRARRKEAMHLKKELKNVNVKENNRNFERMFIGETIEVERMKTKENDAAHKNDDDDDDDDDNEGWYYPRDWTLKTRATFAKICSLDDDDDNDDAEDFDEDFDEEKARKISSSKSFLVGERRTRRKRRLCRRARCIFHARSQWKRAVIEQELFFLLLFTVIFEFNRIERK